MGRAPLPSDGAQITRLTPVIVEYPTELQFIKMCWLQEVPQMAIGSGKTTSNRANWCEDLQQSDWCRRKPDRCEAEEIEQILIQPLPHAPNDLTAASKLAPVIPLTDVSGVTAMREGTD